MGVGSSMGSHLIREVGVASSPRDNLKAMHKHEAVRAASWPGYTERGKDVPRSAPGFCEPFSGYPRSTIGLPNAIANANAKGNVRRTTAMPEHSVRSLVSSAPTELIGQGRLPVNIAIDSGKPDAKAARPTARFNASTRSSTVVTSTFEEVEESTAPLR
ncbi:hypothetical protein C8Q70DRAFT_1122765 [Cubamyces menziesii]|nr:hypothetical protein C8Q70DRAFT_1122765 [Cubamyces menziesii]